jgi:DNA polymerase III epsilon subunit-like protein
MEETNNQKLIMILDTETTGLPKKRQFTPDNVNYFNESRMIELGYIIYDENKKEIKRYNSLIKPDNFEINNSHIHGITTLDCIVDGKELKNVLNEFYQDLLKVDKLICHNIEFDYNILLNEAYRVKNIELFYHLQKVNRICTLELTQKLYGKKTKLSNWYKLLFNQDPQQNHRALDDVLLLEKCYFNVNPSFL